MEKAVGDNRKGALFGPGYLLSSKNDDSPAEDGSANGFGDAIKRVVENGIGGVVDAVAGPRPGEDPVGESGASAKIPAASGSAPPPPSNGSGDPAVSDKAQSGAPVASGRSQSDLFGSRGGPKEASRSDAEHSKSELVSPMSAGVGRDLRAGGDVGVGSMRSGAEVRTKMLKSSIVLKPKSFGTQQKPLAGEDVDELGGFSGNPADTEVDAADDGVV